jgi:hypothetical protein
MRPTSPKRVRVSVALAGIKGSFTRGWDDCNPTSYITDALLVACGAAALNSTSLPCGDLPAGRVGLFCKESFTPEPFRSFGASFPDPSKPLPNPSETGFDAWVNWACMPTYKEMLMLQVCGLSATIV